MTKAKKATNASRLFKSYIDAILNEAMTDLKNQQQVTNEAFHTRIEEIKDIKSKLELQHFEVARQANEMVKNITELEKAIAEKEGFMALAQTRLGRRASRPNAELVK